MNNIHMYWQNFLLINCILFAIVLSECPKSELLNPCKCDVDVITCGGNEIYNLKHIFETLSLQLSAEKKHFKKLYLNNTAITELKENTFYDLTFDEITIEKAMNLTLINSNAFTETNYFTKMLQIMDSPVINSPNYDIFHVLSLMKNIEVINIWRTSISEIPSHAFKPLIGYQNKLKYLRFWGEKLQKVNNFAFFELSSLTTIDICYSGVDFFPMNVFSFRLKSTEMIKIYLHNNPHLNGSSFEMNSLINIERPAHIDLSYDQISNLSNFLDEKVFSPFLYANEKNRLILTNRPIDCNDCRSYWIKQNLKVVEKIVDLKCNNGKEFFDNLNFVNCDSNR